MENWKTLYVHHGNIMFIFVENNGNIDFCAGNDVVLRDESHSLAQSFDVEICVPSPRQKRLPNNLPHSFT